MAYILIIDDDYGICDVMARLVRRLGHEANAVGTLADGLDSVNSADFDVVFLDVHLPDGNGLDAIPVIKQARSGPEVIIITGYPSPEGAELAMKYGAWDYVTKTAPIQEMKLLLTRAIQYRQAKAAAARPLVLKANNIIGQSGLMTEALAIIARAAGSSANLLIQGETGTGKELFARAVHENSDRAGGRFVVVDCGTLPDSLVESILFGHKRGAYTGADHARPGLVAQADKGTLFLDEVGELPMAIQKAFLRVIQERCFLPLGAAVEEKSDFRLIAATNRNLAQMAQEGRFREDLLFRLRGLFLELPPLRHHLEDLKDLVSFHVNRLCDLYGTETKGLSPEFVSTLSLYHWPGNVRELINALEQSLAAAALEPILYPQHLPVHIRAYIKRASLAATTPPPMPPAKDQPVDDQPTVTLPDYRAFHHAMERQYLIRLMALAQGQRQAAMAISGLSRTRLFELLKKHNLD